MVNKGVEDVDWIRVERISFSEKIIFFFGFGFDYGYRFREHGKQGRGVDDRHSSRGRGFWS
jgi:hypoxanthine-guanine phosphoribosyltransferase